MIAITTLALGMVIADAQILTLDPALPRARHAAIVDGRFAYLGDDLARAREAAGPDARELDALGATIVPGFNDAHVHFGLSLTIGAAAAIDLREGAESRAAFERAITEAAAVPIARDHHDWIFVTTRALPAGVVNSADLPKINRPLFVVTERGGILNAIAQKRIALSQADAPAGHVRGRLVPAALDRIVKSLPQAVLVAGARRFLADAAQLGLTSLQLMDELPELFEQLRLDGELTARIRMMTFGYRFETPRYVPTWRSPDPSFVKIDAVKYFHDDWARLPRTELAHIYAEARARDHQVVVHVLSQPALRSLLDQLEHLEAGSPGGARHFRIDHADEVSAELALRLHRLGMIVCPNPAMLPEWHTPRAFPMRTLLDAGVTTCIGSDFVGRHDPARPLDPRFALEMAVTHGGFGSEEKISALEALRAYSVGSAAAEGREDLGALRIGAAADLVGLSADPTAILPSAYSSLEVRFTMVGGRVVYERRPVAKTPRVAPPTIGPADTPAPRVRPTPPTIGPVPKR